MERIDYPYTVGIAPEGQEPVLSVRNLAISFKSDEGYVHAVRGVSFDLYKEETLCIVGESGSGKSTVAMSVARLLPSPPAFYPKGRILLDGEEILSLPLERLRQIRGKKIGVIFQDPMGSLSPLHRIGDQLVETVLLHEDVSKAAARELALTWLGKVRGSSTMDPTSWARAYPHELSGGMQQRVMIAMGLMLEPDLVIADEPTTALDVTVQAQVLQLMRDLHRANSAVLLITHDLGVVSQMATRLAVMKDGRVIETSDDPAAFFTHPRHPYSQALVGEARKMELT